MRKTSFVNTDISISRDISSSYDDVKVVADNIEDVVAVADNEVSISEVHANAADISTVAADITNVNTVAVDIANVGINADNIVDINTVASQSANMTEVVTTIVPNLPEILQADNNASTATTKAAESLASANASEVSRLASEDARDLSLTYSNNSSNSAVTSVDAKDISVAQATIATTKADEASTSASNASTSEANALSYKNAASVSSGEALTQANRAESEADRAVLATDGKVDKVVGKELSDNNYTDVEQAKVGHIAVTQAVNLDTVESDTALNSAHRVSTANPHSVTKAQVGLGSVDNTSDVDKPVSTAQQIALDTKVAKVTSTNNALAVFDGTTGALKNSDVNIAQLRVENIKVKPTLDLDFTTQEYKEYIAPDGLTGEPLSTAMDVTRATTATYIDPTGKIRTAGVNVPRISYDTETGEGALLVEESRTNLLFPSDLNNNSDLGYTRSLVTGLDGVSTSAIRMTEDTTTNQRRFRDTTTNPASISVGTKVTMSVYVKTYGDRDNIFLLLATEQASGANSLMVEYALSDNTFGTVYSTLHTFESQNIEDFGNGWSRLSFTITAAEDITAVGAWLFFSPMYQNGNGTYLGDGVSYLDFFAAQIEEGSTPSSYIPTTTTQVTRASDSVTKDLSVMDGWNSEEFSVYCEYLPYEVDINNFVWDLVLDGDDRVGLQLINGTQLLRGFFRNGTYITASLSTSVVPNQKYKTMVTYKDTTFSVYTNGVKIGEDTYSGKDINFVNFVVGAIYTSGVARFSGLNSDTKLYPKALTEAQAISLTTPTGGN